MNLALPTAWRRRDAPLEPSALVAHGPVAARLTEHLLRRTDDALARLHGVAAPSLLALLGPSHELPWVDGVVYLGRDPRAPSLLLPTTLEPQIHPSLLERALLADTAAPLIVLIDPPRRISLAGARPITPSRLRALCQSSIDAP